MRGRRLSLLALGATGLLFATLTAGCTVDKSGDEAGEQSSFCWGTLDRGDVAKMSVRPPERYVSDDGDLEDRTQVWCEVAAGRSDQGNLQDKEFTLVLDADRPVSVWRMANRVAGESPFRGAVDGVPGWVNRSMAGVLLPSACAKSLRVGHPAYLRIEADNDQNETWKDGELQERMTAVLMKAATGLTERLGCSTSSFTEPKTAPELLEPRALDPGAACGLPGFAPLRPSAPPFKEYVTPGDARLWSCAFGTSEDRGEAVNFTVTQDPGLLWFFKDEEPGQTLLTCAGRPTLLQAGSSDSSDEMSGAEHVRPSEELFAAFKEAVRNSPLC